jgi:hypothetical protein
LTANLVDHQHLDKQRIVEKPRDGKSTPFTLSEWCDVCPMFDAVKYKRSLRDDLRALRRHLKPFFWARLLTQIERESLTRYIDQRSEETLIVTDSQGNG